MREVVIPAGDVELQGNLEVPAGATGIVIFAHGSGSSRHSSRNKLVAGELNEARLATLLFDLLTSAEEQADAHSGHLRFDIDFLAGRLIGATQLLRAQPETTKLSLGYFGASTGGGAAIVAAAEQSDIAAVVSRGGRPDLAGDALERTTTPTLLIVGSRDTAVLQMNREAMGRMKRAAVTLEIVPNASHLFEEPGTLEQVATLARDFLRAHLL